MDKTIRENDAIALLQDLPGTPMVAGDTGIVVYAYDNGHAFEVEFANPVGKPPFSGGDRGRRGRSQTSAPREGGTNRRIEGLYLAKGFGTDRRGGSI